MISCWAGDAEMCKYLLDFRGLIMKHFFISFLFLSSFDINLLINLSLSFLSLSSLSLPSSPPHFSFSRNGRKTWWGRRRRKNAHASQHLRRQERLFFLSFFPSPSLLFFPSLPLLSPPPSPNRSLSLPPSLLFPFAFLSSSFPPLPLFFRS